MFISIVYTVTMLVILIVSDDAFLMYYMMIIGSTLAILFYIGYCKDAIIREMCKVDEQCEIEKCEAEEKSHG